MTTTTEFQLVDINKLVPYANNARTHNKEQILKLRSSLREFGFVNPVIIDREYNVLAGHGRIMAAKEEGIAEVPCVYADHLTEAQKKAYILADNRMALDAGWDEELLAVEMEELQNLGFDLGLTGFDESEIADLFDINSDEAKQDDFDVDAELKAVVENASKAVDAKMADLRVADAITEIFNLFKRCNKYIDETTPWVLGKDESKKDRLSTVLWNLIQSISEGARLLESFMPSTSKKILEQLGNGHVTEKPEILFQRMDLEEVMKKVEELHPKVEEKREEEAVIDIEPKDEITFEQFGAMQFQVGEIIACEAVKKSKKLLCSQVKVGSQVKQIVSGIKAHYTPEEMVGKKVMVLVNLKPAKLAGVLSEGMLLCAEDAEGNLALMTPEKEMPAGAEIC